MSDASLSATAAVFVDDLRHLTGASVPSPIVAPPRDGDILLQLGTAYAPEPAESYRLTISRRIAIRAATDAGVFNGTRTVLQLLARSRVIPGGSATDWPSYSERGLLVDVGRKYFTPDWLYAQIREMSYLKLNYLHLHLSDVYGFRLESETHPEAVSAQHYTKQQIRDLVAYAAARHIQVVPEIDMPGHMTALLASHPELQLKDVQGRAAGAYLDLAAPGAYPFMKDLLTEYLPLFPGQFWSIGADEYAPGHQAAFYAYVNWADSVVRATGKTARMWNDGLKAVDGAASVNADIVIDYWSSGGPTPWSGEGLTPAQLAAAGHLLLNNPYQPVYYTIGHLSPLNATPKAMYENWDPSQFVGDTRLDARHQNADLGSMIDLWCDDPEAETPDQITADLAPRLAIMAQLTWGSPKPSPSVDQFLSLRHSLGPAPA